MQLVRVRRDDRIVNGYRDGNTLWLNNGEIIDDSEAEYAAPAEPTKIIALHLNFPSRIEAFGCKVPRWPSYFMKPVSSLAGHRSAAARPRNTQYLNYEGEIALVVSKRAKNVSREDAWDYIAGYSPAIDYGLHDFRTSDAGSMLRVKGQDGFCPIGPTLIPAHQVDPNRLTLRTYVNGKVVQEDRTDTLLFPFDYLIADLSRLLTLEPGDVILTGTPKNSRPVQPGDVVEVEIEGFPRLTTTVVESEVDFADFGAQPEDSDNARNTAFEIE
jgi:5-oxopent-3-ene-1,2,5-tricarboxylate decarboxylase/2-hydroxyhepta-2,4-diene-1,7-dioate isomerase